MEGVYREGLRNVTKLDMQYADLLGYCIKLLGIVEPVGPDRILARVHPTLLPKAHPLASVHGVYNALWVHGDFVGDVMFSGRGAGSDPTASAVIGDLIDVGRKSSPPEAVAARYPLWYGRMLTGSIDDLRTLRFYLRIQVQDLAEGASA